MRKTSGGFGLVLAAVTLAGGVPLGIEGGRLAPALALGAGAALVVLSLLTIRKRRWAQVLLSLGGLSVLGWFLPVYFRTSQMWPYLALIILGSSTFGLAVLGVLLDAYDSRDSRPL